jgi:hypothetical protein
MKHCESSLHMYFIKVKIRIETNNHSYKGTKYVKKAWRSRQKKLISIEIETNFEQILTCEYRDFKLGIYVSISNFNLLEYQFLFF